MRLNEERFVYRSALCVVTLSGRSGPASLHGDERSSIAIAMASQMQNAIANLDRPQSFLSLCASQCL